MSCDIPSPFGAPSTRQPDCVGGVGDVDGGGWGGVDGVRGVRGVRGVGCPGSIEAAAGATAG